MKIMATKKKQRRWWRNVINQAVCKALRKSYKGSGPGALEWLNKGNLLESITSIAAPIISVKRNNNMVSTTPYYIHKHIHMHAYIKCNVKSSAGQVRQASKYAYLGILWLGCDIYCSRNHNKKNDALISSDYFYEGTRNQTIKAETRPLCLAEVRQCDKGKHASIYEAA